MAGGTSRNISDLEKLKPAAQSFEGTGTVGEGGGKNNGDEK
jgi:hypothetical protein